MPKVGTHRIQFRDGSKAFDIWYKSTDGFSIKGYPEDMKRTVESITNKRVHYFNTEAECISYYDGITKQYYEITKTERHVIRIRMKLSNGITMYPMENGYQGTKDAFVGMRDKLMSTFGSGLLNYSICFDYDTGIILSASTKDKWFDTTQDEQGNIIKRGGYGRDYSESEACAILDYSLETELFLKKVQEQMTSLAIKMASFFTDKDKLLLAVQSNQKLLSDG